MKRVQDLATHSLKRLTGPKILCQCPCTSSETVQCVSSIACILLQKPRWCLNPQLQQGNHAQTPEHYSTDEICTAESLSLTHPALLQSTCNSVYAQNHNLSCTCIQCLEVWQRFKTQAGAPPFSVVGTCPKDLKLQLQDKMLLPISFRRGTFAKQDCIQRAAYSTEATDNTSKNSNNKVAGSSDSPEKQNDVEKLDPALEVMTSSTASSALRTVKVVPGKGPPPEPPVTCCMSGCPNCVWIAYAEELKDYYNDGGLSAKEALEKIEDPSLKAFVKLELGLK